VRGSRQEEGGERGELLPIYPINRTLDGPARFIPCPCPRFTYCILLTTNLAYRDPDQGQIYRSRLPPRHSDNSIPPHASGLKVSCRRSHHHRLRRALFDRLRLKRDLDCTALEIGGSTVSL
jgi:hypothetical protein